MDWEAFWLGFFAMFVICSAVIGFIACIYFLITAFSWWWVLIMVVFASVLSGLYQGIIN